MTRQVRINFTDKEKDLYLYLDTKTSKSAFIKDLIRREMLRDNNYINCGINTTQLVISENKENPIQVDSADEFEFDLEDLDLD